MATVLRFKDPKFCSDRECGGLVKGRVVRAKNGALLHSNCASIMRLPEPLEEVIVRYAGKLPKNLKLWKLERLEAIKPLERIAEKLDREDARRMYLALAEVYVIMVIRKKDEITKGELEFLSERYLPEELFTFLDHIPICGLITCAGKIQEGLNYRMENGTLLHPRCISCYEFETYQSPGELTEIYVKYNCEPPRDKGLERLLQMEEIRTLDEIFSKLPRELAYQAWNAVMNLIEQTGICGQDLIDLAKKY